MLKCRLAVLLAERNLKITKVSKDTGISRTTLTSLANNFSQGIQFDTLNTLCSYLRTTPRDFFCYVPFEVEILANYLESKDIKVTLNFKNSQGEKLDAVDLTVNAVLIEYDSDSEQNNSRKTQGKLTIIIDFPKTLDEAITLGKYKEELSPIFTRDIERNICTEVASLLSPEKNPNLDFEIIRNNAFA